MTPKEKAKELVDKFDEFTVHYEWREKNDNAIECALIAVKEILEQFEDKCTDSKYYYFIDVKIELEKLYI
jgi:hypothetical protein